MKILKSTLASFLLLALTTAFATKGQAQTTKYYKWTGASDFVIASGTVAALETTSNWTVQATQPIGYTGTGKICYETVSYTLGLGQTDPTEQEILNALGSKYVVNIPPSPNNFSFDSGSTDTITVTSVGSSGVTVTFVLSQKS